MVEQSFERTKEEVISPDWDEVVSSFDDMGLDEKLLNSIYSNGLDRPSVFQQRTIMAILKGVDVVAEARAGVGKTVAFNISILQKVCQELGKTQVLVLAPTREVTWSIKKDIIALGGFRNANVHACFGGYRIANDEAALSAGAHIVVGTPSRVFELINRQILRTDAIKMFVVDELHEVISHGYKDQINEVFRLLPPEVQVVMNSCYMSTDILEVTTMLMRNPIRNPIRITVESDELSYEFIRQFYISVEKEESKVDTLVGLFENINFTDDVTIFCNTRRDVDLVTEKLRESIRTVSAIHSKIEQAQHETISTDFCSASSRVLVTTDLPTLFTTARP